MSSGAETRRLFFALEPGAGVRAGLVSMQRAIDLPARRVAPENLHITLAFLGDVHADRIAELHDIAGALAFPACRLDLDRCGWFPRSGVVWLGSGEPPPALLEFRQALNGALAAGGYRSETRPWLPHVTLYRKMRKRHGTIPVEAVAWELEGFCLKQSSLGRAGPVYSTLGSWAASS